jgi:DNA-binding MarR family transcriptional regulator
MAAIHALRRTFTDFNRRIAAASGASVSMADVLALQFVAHAENATPGGIGSFTGLTSGSVTTMLDRLEQAGFVKRERASADRRSVVVRMVPGARQKLASLMIEAHIEVGKMFDGWEAADVESLVALLERLNLAHPHGH